MEENNEYGNCWEDLLKRNDMENERADAELERWARQDEENPELARCKDGYGPEWMRRGWEEERETAIRDRKGVLKESNKKSKGKRRSLDKAKTGGEMKTMITEMTEVRAVKKAKTDAKKMVKKGAMQTIDKYFK